MQGRNRYTDTFDWTDYNNRWYRWLAVGSLVFGARSPDLLSFAIALHCQRPCESAPPTVTCAKTFLVMLRHATTRG